MCLRLLDIPELQIALAAIHARDPEVELSRPVSAMMHGVLSPYCASSGSRVWRCEDDAVREDLGVEVIAAASGEVRYVSEVGGDVDAVFVAEAEVVYDVLCRYCTNHQRCPCDRP